MGFISWLTGKPSGDQIDLDIKLASEVVNSLNNVSTVTITNEESNVAKALENLNSVKGIDKIGGPVVINTSGMFSDFSEMVNEIGQNLEKDSDSVQAYSNGKSYNPLTVGVASGLMAASNVGEGFLSAFEDIGDAVCIAGAWVTKLFNNDISQKIQNFAAKDLSHSLFDKLYYSTDLAKASLFTEDSGAASIFRGVGQASAYLTMGGWLAGSSEALSAAGKGGKLVQALTSTTKANTLVAAVGGLGSGSEIGLQNGSGLGKATWMGAKEAAVQGVLAFGAGKLGEHFNKKALAKDAQKAIDNADDTFKTAKAAADNADDALKNAKSEYKAVLDNKKELLKQSDDLEKLAKDAQQELDDVKKGLNPFNKKRRIADAENKVIDANKKLDEIRNKISTTESEISTKHAQVRTLDQSAQDLRVDANKADEALKKAQQALDDIKAGKGVQGYTDKVTELGRNKGLRDGQIRADKLEKIGDVADDASFLEKAGVGLKKVGAGVKAEAEVVATDAKGVATNVFNAVKHPLKTVKAIPGAIKTETIGAVTTAARQAPTLGKVAAGSAAYVAGNALREAARNKADLASAMEQGGNPPGPEKPDITPIPAPGGTENPTGTETPSSTTKEDPFKTDTTTTDTTTTETPTTDEFVSSPYNTPYSPGSGGETYTPTPAVTIPTPTTEVEEPTEFESVEESEPEVTTPTVPIPTFTIPTPTVTTPTITTPATTTVQQTTGGYTGGGTSHYGGEYNAAEGFNADDLLEEVTEPELDDLVEDAATSIDEIVNGTKTYTKIPTSSTPLNKPTSTKKGNSFIPIAAGLSAAAAAGLGAKAYLDHKNNNDNGEEEEDYEDDWTDAEDIEIDEDQTSYHEQYLNDDYNNVEEKYDAKTQEDLAEIQ